MVQRISLAHGEGGELTHHLIQDVFIQSFGHSEQTQLDSAVLAFPSQTIAVTTDSFVVNPLFFPGGNIGRLAVTGTVNDLAVSGAIPLFMTAGFIIEEGFPLNDLKEIVKSMAAEALKAGVKIVAGDTKVVEKGSADGLFINTAGIGEIRDHRLKSKEIREGDCVIINGTIGDHGIAILSARQELGLLTDVKSDCTSLNQLIHELMKEIDGIRIMRDPTRGGLATTLVELCEDFHFTVELDEIAVPIRKDVRGACDILGFDPLYLANEGKVVIIVDENQKQKVLRILKNHEYGQNACVIGQVTSCQNQGGKLLLKTPIGTTRRLHRLAGMILPRIC
ncbi:MULTISPECIES: hydrogenase expression/formation protein HypE [Metabacillus]|uniref:Hydrogenase expression/formation protein HypE n=1 Tax=Metabacillus hrfriensis TaxID=3048891 RepID=A0ACD4RF48_9BACI|nr:MULTISPECIES: hydrogenase expression/formation protein HypE [Metabacillus]UAL53561.1 hydrogenase expression/formation protein HypE [Metabacillus dongyingensis]UOK59024.1 hydrogenase expression/formation protein HypE [Bacillus sp. OVS6]USK29870.1 hydrogenase expression/formation protein HypE [Bacillus sp. CMF21]WHZ59122.1 hydrogenase expression/formation protein HypE [Metabacillus sp. CT-WN-B3]